MNPNKQHSTNPNRKQVKPNCWVRISGFESDGEEETFYIVPPPQADAQQNRISDTSPLAQALLGTHCGDTVPYNPPGGAVELKVVDVGSL